MQMFNETFQSTQNIFTTVVQYLTLTFFVFVYSSYSRLFSELYHLSFSTDKYYTHQQFQTMPTKGIQTLKVILWM